MTTLGDLISEKIKENTVGDVIKVSNLAEGMGYEFSKKKFDDPLLKGIVSPPSEDSKSKGVISFERRNSCEENKTLTAMLIARAVQKYSVEKILKREEIDIFSLREIREAKMSEQMILATRLAIPEHIITKLDNDLKFNNGDYTKKSKLLPQFVGAAFHITGNGLFEILDSLDLNATITLNKIRVEKKTAGAQAF